MESWILTPTMHSEAAAAAADGASVTVVCNKCNCSLWFNPVSQKLDEGGVYILNVHYVYVHYF